MTTIKQWLRITPLDTLFFKGSEPMIMSENHEVRTVFPPLPTTIIGAIRTAILGQRSIDPYQYTGGGHEAIIEKFPYLGPPEKPGFELVGPLFEITTAQGHEILLPAPSHWHGNLKEAAKNGSILVRAAKPAKDLLKKIGLCGSSENPLWLTNPEGNKNESLTGWWANAAALVAMQSGEAMLAIPAKASDLIPGKPAFLPLDALYVIEARTGIAIDQPARQVREGYLYSTTHVRLQPEVAILAGLSQSLSPQTLDPKGILQLGGERRVARYECLGEKEFDFPVFKSGNWVLAVSAIPWQEFSNSGLDKHPRASAPLVRMGGWDMKKQFHKDMTAWLPPGTAIYLDNKNDLPFGFISI